MLTRPLRLRGNQDFRRVYKRGRSYVHPIVVLYVLRHGSGRRFGFSVSKKLGGSVQRNRIKRLLREACRSRIDSLGAGFDAILVGRSAIRDAPFEAIQAAVDELFRRAGLVGGRKKPCGDSASD